ncbi:hypothetical protein LG943_14820 [Streptomonospora sp. S1-112]|uniref:Uncharacterized protein n=1 Tax=Streptomonospora mangrovi TaxID=2883123 RepID=A0A9X3NLA5_9ACTN|nr:hypothetical protein [Streptomonospora mangrovi]MDA0565577.1 hypothetical protein [Streptomonospora mangrovi]
MSDHQTPLAGVAAGFAAVFAVALAPTGRERGYATILGWMLWSQFGLHVVFTAAQLLAEPGGAAPAAAHLGHTLPAAAPQEGGGGGGAGMFAVHVAAAAVSSWWLRGGEAAAFRLARHLRALLADALPRVVRPRWTPAPRPLAPAPVRPAPRLPAAVLRHALVVRGPPLLLAAP